MDQSVGIEISIAIVCFGIVLVLVLRELRRWLPPAHKQARRTDVAPKKDGKPKLPEPLPMWMVCIRSDRIWRLAKGYTVLTDTEKVHLVSCEKCRRSLESVRPGPSRTS